MAEERADGVDEQTLDFESGPVDVDGVYREDLANVTVESANNTTSSSPPKKRGRPRKGESRSSSRVPAQRRSNPDRSVRHKTLHVDDDSSDLQASISSEPPVEVAPKKPARKRKSAPGGGTPGGRPRGRPRKPVEKPKAVVRPTPRDPENQPSTCKWNHCGVVLPSLLSLKAHIENIHFERIAPFKCAWTGCDRLDPFQALYQLRLHLRGHIGEKPHVCTLDNCTRKFTRLENLKTHVRRVHTDEFPYHCTQCDKAFTNASDRSKHENRTHGNFKQYKCPVDECTKTYTDPSSLRKHMKKGHGDAAYEMAKVNKRLNGPNGDYGFVPVGLNIRAAASRSPSPAASPSPDSPQPEAPTFDQFEPIGEPSTSRAYEEEQ